MTADEIRELYSYNEWANKKYIEVIQNLDEEKYTLEIRSSFSSIRDTMAHIFVSEWTWLQRRQCKSPSAPPDWSVKPSIKVLIEKVNEIELERRNFLSGLDDDALQRLISYNLLSGKAGQNTLQELFLHLVNHSSYHRGQLATLFRQLELKPPSTDLILFYREKKGTV